MFFKRTLFAGLVPVLLTGLLFISCPQPTDGNPPAGVVNAQSPNITAQPHGGNWNVTDYDEFTLTVTATSPDKGTISYQWYKAENDNDTDSEEIDGEDKATLTLAKSSYTGDGDLYFYVVVTNTNNNATENKTAIATSNIAKVTVSGNGVAMVNADHPTISGQPTGGSWDVNSANNFTLTVTASVTDGGTLSYQWYQNTTNTATGGTVAGTDNATLTLAKEDYTSNGACYFYVVVKNTITDNHDGGVKTATTTSNVATVTVSDNIATVNAEQPTITSQPVATITWNVNTVPATLSGSYPSITATSPDGGSLSYQWYRNTANSTAGGTAINGATNATLNLTSLRSSELSSGNGTRYFYAVVTNTNNSVSGNPTATTTSSAAAITIQGIVPFSPVANWTAGKHDSGTAYFETIMQAVTGYYPSGLGDEYLIRRYGDLTAAEKNRFGITATATLNGTAIQNNDYIYAYAFPDMMAFMDSAYFYGVIRAINIFSEAGANNTDWRGIFVVQFMKLDTWGYATGYYDSPPPTPPHYHGYYFGFAAQDTISSMCNMYVDTGGGGDIGGFFSYTDTIDGVISAFTYADRRTIIGGLGTSGNLYGGNWNREPNPWPAN